MEDENTDDDSTSDKRACPSPEEEISLTKRPRASVSGAGEDKQPNPNPEPQAQTKPHLPGQPSVPGPAHSPLPPAQQRPNKRPRDQTDPVGPRSGINVPQQHPAQATHQIPPPIHIDPQEADRYRAIWEFVVIFRLIRGSELCRPCQDMILDLISNDPGASGTTGFNNHHRQFMSLPSRAGYPLPPGFNRQYLDYLVNPELTSDQISNLPLSAAPSSRTLSDAGEGEEAEEEDIHAGLPLSFLSGPFPEGGNKTVITPTMYLHYRSFRNIVRVIEAQAKIWITTRPEHFRSTLHDVWMLGLPEEFAVKLWFACQGRYTLVDLAVGRDIVDPGVTGPNENGCESGSGNSYMNMMRRYLAAVADGGICSLGRPPGEGTCTCPGVGWYQEVVAGKSPEREAAAVAAMSFFEGNDPGGRPMRDRDCNEPQSFNNIPDVRREQLLDQQVIRFINGTGNISRTTTTNPTATSQPTYSGNPNPYLDSQINTVLSSTTTTTTRTTTPNPFHTTPEPKCNHHEHKHQHPTNDNTSTTTPSHINIQTQLKHLSQIGLAQNRQILKLHYQSLQTIYKEVEPILILPNPTPQNPYPLTNPFTGHYPPAHRLHHHGHSTSNPCSGANGTVIGCLKPFSFRKCDLYAEMQCTSDQWGIEASRLFLQTQPDTGTDTGTGTGTGIKAGTNTGLNPCRQPRTNTTLGPDTGENIGTCTCTMEGERNNHQQHEKQAKQAGDLINSILGNQPWDWPTNWTGQGERYLQGPAQELRQAIAFLVSGSLQWIIID